MPSQEMLDFWELCPPMPPRMPEEDLPAARAATEQASIEALPGLPEVALELVDCGGVAAVWYSPPDHRDDQVVLYTHGGGFMWSSATSHQGLISRVASAARTKVIALDYKLAPASPFPGPLEEAVTLYRWLLDQGYEPSKIAIAGDSAGGGLALSLVSKLKGDGASLPACVVATSAWADLSNSGETIDTVSMDPCVSRVGLEICRENYLQGHDPLDPLASPAFADYEGFPPLLLQVGSREQLLSDTLKVAARADAAGVDVTLEVYDRCVHLWNWWVPNSPEARESIEREGSFIQRHTTGD